MGNKWTDRLKKAEHAVKDMSSPFLRGCRTPSPSTNFIFGNTHLLPFGYSMLLWGPPGGGKSYLFNSMVGQLHRDYPDAIAVKFDTEFRDQGQMTEEMAAAFGVDLNRYIVFQVNKASEVFNYFESEIGDMVASGAPIRLVGMDSVNGIQGRRESDAESIDQHNIGDHAQTLQIGCKMILPVQRRGGISVVMNAHQRAEFDMLEQRRGNKTKAGVSWGVKHHCEYAVYVERDETKLGRSDELGNVLEDANRKDMTEAAQGTGHKVRVWMQKTSFGDAGRSGAFTLDYKRGIINQHEEVFLLGVRWGIIQRPTAAQYVFGADKFNGKPAMLAALAANPKMQQAVVTALLAEEKKGRIDAVLSAEKKAKKSEDNEPDFGGDA